MAGVRPPLPPGPFLVVGLARSGVAAAIALRARGAAVIGLRRRGGRRGGRGRAGRRPACRCTSATDGVALLEGVATLVKSPGVPQEAPVVRAARARGMRVIGELEVGWRLLSNEVVAITGSNGKTTTTELVGAIHRAAGVPVAVAGNVGTALSSLAGTLSPDTVVVCEARRSSSRTRRRSRPRPRCCSTSRRTTSTGTARFDAYRAAKLRSSRARTPAAIAVLPGGLEPTVRRGACASRAADGRRAAAGAGGRRGRATAARAGAASPSSRRPRSGSAARTTSRTRWRPPRSRSRAASTPRAVRDGAARRSRASRTGWRRSPRVGGVLYVDDSKATNVASAVVGHPLVPRRRARDPRRPRQGRGLRAARRAPSPSAAAPLPDRGGGRARSAPRSRATRRAVHDCGDLERAVAAARAAAARRGRPALARPAPPTTSTAPSRSAATTSRRWRAADEAADSSRARRRREASDGGRRKQRLMARTRQQPLEHRLLLTATFCLLAGGAVMVYSASSARTLLEGQGDGTAYLVKYLMYGAVGLVVMHVLARHGLAARAALHAAAAGGGVRAAAARAAPGLRRRRSTARAAGSAPARCSSSRRR